MQKKLALICKSLEWPRKISTIVLRSASPNVLDELERPCLAPSNVFPPKLCRRAQGSRLLGEGVWHRWLEGHSARARGYSCTALPRRAIDDAVNVVRCVTRDPNFVPGAGATVGKPQWALNTPDPAVMSSTTRSGAVAFCARVELRKLSWPISCSCLERLFLGWTAPVMSRLVHFVSFWSHVGFGTPVDFDTLTGLRDVQSKDQYAVLKFAEALEVVPKAVPGGRKSWA